MTSEQKDEHDDSLNALADKLLSVAEGLFGPRTSNWTLLGVQYNDQQPHLRYYPELGGFAISLGFKAIDDERQRVFQLAHEVCHALYPTRDKESGIRPDTIVLNEGVSTYFSIFVLTQLWGPDLSAEVTENLRIHSPDYFSALTHVTALLQKDAEAIRKLRTVQPLLNDITAQDFPLAGVQFDPLVVEQLVSPFNSGGGRLA